MRPGKDVHILTDFVKSDAEGSRTLWSTKVTFAFISVLEWPANLLPTYRSRTMRCKIVLLHLVPVFCALLDCDLNNHRFCLLSMIPLVRCPKLFRPRVVTDLFAEFIISDLALASHSITSFTISSSTLLAPVFESHIPTAIITHAELLPQILELIYDAGDRTGNHTIIVVGEPSPQAMASVVSTVKILRFPDIEREGVRVEKSISPLPSESCRSVTFCLKLKRVILRSY